MSAIGERETGEGVLAGRVQGVLITAIPEDQEERETILRSGLGHLYDFYQVPLAGIDLTGADLRNGTLVGCDLAGAQLRGACLVGADLRGATLTGACLRDADLTGACLSRSRLEGADLSRANLTDARFQLARYDSKTQWAEGFEWPKCGAIGPGASLAGAFLNTADLEDADLAGANLIGAYLSGANLKGANLKGARLSGATLSKACLMGAYLKDARLGNVNLEWADCRAADFGGVEVDLLESIAGADFYKAQNISAGLRSFLLGQPLSALNTRNSFTRRTTKESLLDL